MILGDNIFYGNGLGAKLGAAKNAVSSGVATVFGYYVEDPHRFGVMEIEKEKDANGAVRVLSVVEKPKEPKSNYAIVGLYFYPAGVSDMADKVKPSARGELEITTLNAGTIESLKNATNFVSMIEEYQGMSISAPEEIAYRYGWITDEELSASAEKYGKSPYGEHLRAVLEDKVVL